MPDTPLDRTIEDLEPAILDRWTARWMGRINLLLALAIVVLAVRLVRG